MNARELISQHRIPWHVEDGTASNLPCVVAIVDADKNVVISSISTAHAKLYPAICDLANNYVPATFPHGDERCIHFQDNTCWVDDNDPEYKCVGIEFCPNATLVELD